MSKETPQRARLEPRISRSGVRGVNHSATHTSTFPMKERQNSPLVLLFSNEKVKRVSVDRIKKFPLLKVNKLIRNSNESSFEYLLTYLSLSINGLREMWLGLLTFYFRSMKGSQNISLGSSLGLQISFLAG